MRTGIMNVLVHRWPLATALAVSIHLLGVGVGVAEQDHLKGYKIKDLNQVAPPANPYTLTNQFGSETCDLKKPQFFLVQSAKNGGNDPRGGAAGDFVCYKAKCTGPLPPVTDADSQFGVHQLETKKAKLVCLPVDTLVCGDGDLDPGEACDPPGNITQCAGSVACNSDCTCPPDPCSGSVQGDPCGSCGSGTCQPHCGAGFPEPLVCVVVGGGAYCLFGDSECGGATPICSAGGDFPGGPGCAFGGFCRASCP